jgi:hypothetical protein
MTWEKWSDCLGYIKNCSSKDSFEVFKNSQAIRKNGTITIVVATNRHVEILNSHRLDKIIIGAVKFVEPTVGDFELKYSYPEEPSLFDDPIEPIGSYIDQRNKIIKPEQVEVHTQYFRIYWRPRLGPLLSELIRELRQRAYSGRGKDKTRRDTVSVTQSLLAHALGVSEKTVKRALLRDRKTGRFICEDLNKFILNITIVKRESDKGYMVNDKTLFTIALDEPLIPEHDDNFPKGQNDL